MPRVDTQTPSQTYFIKQRSPSNCCPYLSLAAIAITFFTAFFVIKNPTESLHTIQKYTARTIPDTFNSPEGIDPEDRAVFEGFKTSFLPAEEIILAKRNSKAKREVYEGNITSDILIWSGLEKRPGHPARVKRLSHYTFMSQDCDDPGPIVHGQEKGEDNFEDEDEYDDESPETEDYGMEESATTPAQDDQDRNEDEADQKSKRPPDPHFDQGPFDDVVEQIRGQPELEEGEMGSAAKIYKPARSYTVIHAFWKGQGDRKTIRETQAKIMRQYMDQGADPCIDFYQYACGNWPALNPIPADKAGYDTFEMLRENLDTVLKDLLEFKPNERVECKFPGHHLDLDDNFLRKHVKPMKPREAMDSIEETLEKVEQELQDKKTEYNKNEIRCDGSEDINITKNKTDLDMKSDKQDKETLTQVEQELQNKSLKYGIITSKNDKSDVTSCIHSEIKSNKKDEETLKQVELELKNKTLINQILEKDPCKIDNSDVSRVRRDLNNKSNKQDKITLEDVERELQNNFFKDETHEINSGKTVSRIRRDLENQPTKQDTLEDVEIELQNKILKDKIHSINSVKPDNKPNIIRILRDSDDKSAKQDKDTLEDTEIKLQNKSLDIEIHKMNSIKPIKPDGNRIYRDENSKITKEEEKKIEDAEIELQNKILEGKIREILPGKTAKPKVSQIRRELDDKSAKKDKDTLEETEIQLQNKSLEMEIHKINSIKPIKPDKIRIHRGEDFFKQVKDTLEEAEIELQNKILEGKIREINSGKTHKSNVSRIHRDGKSKIKSNMQPLRNMIKRRKYKYNNSKAKYRRNEKEISKNVVTRKKRLVRSKWAQPGRKLLMFNRKAGKRKEPGIFRKLFRDTSALFEKQENHTIKTNDAALKARYLFKSCMNYQILEARGHQPLLDLLDLLGGWPILNTKWNKTDFDWLETTATLRLYNNDILISEWVGPDIKNSDEFVIQFDQTSLGLPTRDYFLQKSNKLYLEAYKKYLLTIALLLGGDPKHVCASADKLIDFEISLAKITSAPEDRRNVSELYRRMPLKSLERLVPEVKWRRYLCVVMNRTVYPNETIVLFALTYVQSLVKLINETEPEVLANYLLWRFVRHRVNNLDDRFQSAKQQFYYILFGREQAPPRWKNCISQVNSNMGMALGSMFVKKYFDEMSKNDTLTMTREIQQSFRELLHMTNWIDGDTKKLAAHKVDAMMLRIGYPDFILNKEELDERYKEVIIHPDKYFENILNILQHLTKMEQSRIGQPVNKTLWNTAPAVVNAYYSRNKNQIMFPAGILQPPFYHRHFPRSLNYGGIGVVIGHEITHGFDDKGRLFDCNGNLHRWWSDSAIEAFHRRAQCLIDQYSQYIVPEVNIKLDGTNTQGENIADNGGVKQAFRAYLRWLKKNGAKGETLPGLNHTHTQLFFLNFAQVWCGAMRPEAMRNKLKTAVHSPGRFRVIGTLSNSHDFAREFNCPPGTPMNPEVKCSVW